MQVAAILRRWILPVHRGAGDLPRIFCKGRLAEIEQLEGGHPLGPPEVALVLAPGTPASP